MPSVLLKAQCVVTFNSVYLEARNVYPWKCIMHLSPYREQKGIVTSCSLAACLNLGLHSNKKRMFEYQSSWNPRNLFIEHVGLYSQMINITAKREWGLCVCVAQRTIGCLSWVTYTRSIFINVSHELWHTVGVPNTPFSVPLPLEGAQQSEMSAQRPLKVVVAQFLLPWLKLQIAVVDDTHD